jgi:phosphonoacetaldehyde dehydrogenase
MIVAGKKITSGKKFSITNPYTKKTVARIINANKKLIKSALDKSFKFKCTISSKKRASILSNTALSIKNSKLKYASVIVSELGVSFKDALYEVERVIECANISAQVCRMIDRDITSKFLLKNKNKPKLKVISEPLDLVLAITPFNLPMILAAHKIFPAIIAGTAVVLKPSEKSPLSSMILLETLIKNGLPANMVNIITGKNGKKTVSEIFSKSTIDLVSFTGSLSVGKHIEKMLIDKKHFLKKFIPELGGCSSLIICNDCNLQKAVDITLDGCFKYSGQRCTSVRRVIVEKKIADKFIKLLLSKVKNIKFGNPFDKKNDLGTLVNSFEAKSVQKKINLSIKKGAKLVYGNIRKNSLLSPTILDRVKLNMNIVSSETFGPVCPIIRSNNLKDSIRIASSTNFKIAGSIITNNKKNALKVANELKVGQFSINGPPGYRTELAPFGGFGDSGNGEKEGVILSAENMRRIRVVYDH